MFRDGGASFDVMRSGPASSPGTPAMAVALVGLRLPVSACAMCWRRRKVLRWGRKLTGSGSREVHNSVAIRRKWRSLRRNTNITASEVKNVLNKLLQGLTKFYNVLITFTSCSQKVLSFNRVPTDPTHHLIDVDEEAIGLLLGIDDTSSTALPVQNLLKFSPLLPEFGADVVTVQLG